MQEHTALGAKAAVLHVIRRIISSYLVYKKGRLKARNNSTFFMKHKGKLLIVTSKRPSVAGLNCRLLTSFDGQMKRRLGISTINNVHINSNYTTSKYEYSRHLDGHGILTSMSDANEWPGRTVGTLSLIHI